MINNLKEIRKTNGLSQFDVANKLGYNQTLVSKWEKGKCDPGTEALLKLSNLYNVSIDELLGNERFISEFSSSAIIIPDDKKEIVQKLLALPQRMFDNVSGQIEAYYQMSQL